MTKTTQIAKKEKFLLKDVKDGIRRIVNNNIQSGYSYINLENSNMFIKVWHFNYRIKEIYLNINKGDKYDTFITNSKNLPKIIKTINSFIS